MADDVRKIIDFRDAMNTMIEEIAPKYLSENVDKNRVSTFGYITESLARAWADSIILEQNRSEDYCPELSSNEPHVRQTAHIREVGVYNATPNTAFAALHMLKSDILKKGENTNTIGEKLFRIPKQSKISSNGVSYSFESDIIVRAHIRPNGDYNFSAVYADLDERNSFIQLFEDTTTTGDETITLILRIKQIVYNIQEKAVTDMLQFTYEGLSFDYDNYLAGFEVSYCLPNDTEYKKLTKEYYLTDSVSNSILYNDDDRNIIYILMNPRLNIPVNSMIRIEIQETYGGSQSVAIDNTSTAFTLHKDNAYNYSGIMVAAEIISTPSGGSAGDTLADIRHRLINAKIIRKNITTSNDIIKYINDATANVQIVKKRNDIEDRMYYLYTFLRYGMDIVHTCTKKTIITLDDFDYTENNGKTMVMKVGHMFKLDPETHIVTRIKDGENLDEIRYKVALPFLVKIDESLILTYYCNAIDTLNFLKIKETNPQFSYQLITRFISLYRNPMDDENPDTYTFTLMGTLNTSDDEEIIDKKTGEIKDKDKIRVYIVFKSEGKEAAYLLLEMTSYDKTDRTLEFKGSFKTNDYITDRNTLHITDGLYAATTTDPYDSVIDYKDTTFDVHVFYKDTELAPSITAPSDAILQLPDISDEYIHMITYTNTSASLCNLLIEMNKYSRSSLSLSVKDLNAGSYNYILDEVPYIEYTFCKEHLVDIYPLFLNMYNTYTALIKNTTDFDVNLKFIDTYGPSKYITVTGTTVKTAPDGTVIKNEDGTLAMMDDETYLKNLNPQMRFKVYGSNTDVSEIYNFIYKYMRDTYIIGTSVFVSNICTAIERNFKTVKSIKFAGIDNYDASYQEFTYRTPDLTILENIKSYIPEAFNVSDIVIELEDE